MTSTTLRRVCAVVAFTLTTLHVTASSGQTHPPAAQEDVLPPKLLHFVEATYPPLARDQGREGDVLLAITPEYVLHLRWEVNSQPSFAWKTSVSDKMRAFAIFS